MSICATIKKIVDKEEKQIVFLTFNGIIFFIRTSISFNNEQKKKKKSEQDREKKSLITPFIFSLQKTSDNIYYYPF